MKFFRHITLISLIIVTAIQTSTLRFAWEALKNPGQVGAMFECSSHVGHELMRYVRLCQNSKQIIEVGGGMGSVTNVICHNYLRPKDRLDVIEINQEYCMHLRKKFPRECFPHVHIHCIDILQFKPTIKYDFIICTLPFNAFPNGLVKKLHDQLKLFAKPGTHLSYVEYMVLPTIRETFTQDAAKHQQLVEHREIIERFKKQHLLQTVSVFKNLPPLYVHHLQF